MADLTNKEAALTIKVTGADSSGNETNFIDATVNGVKVDGSAVTQPISAVSLPLPTGASTTAQQTAGNLILADIDANGTTIINNQTNGTQRSQITNGSINVDVTADDPTNTANGLVVRNIAKVRETYGATQKSLVPAASATDVFTITGSASKTVYIHKIIVTGNRTAHAHDLIVLIKRSTANSGGTSSTLTSVSYDSTNAAATAVVRSYTANPTLGTAVGEIYAKRVSFPVQTPSNAQGNGGSVNPWQWIYSDIGQPIVLRGTSQVLAVNLNAVTIAGGNIQCSIEWSEE
jgi:hypothetical protein